MPERPGTEIVPAILHVDMDAFFAAVEVLDDPALAGKPVIVGGSGNRGVVASCTYEARAFGIRSAMPSVRARQLCPGAVFVDGRYERYSEMSRRLHTVLTSTTPLVEPIGLDEAFLDVTGARRLLGGPRDIAESLRSQVRETLTLDCSIGVGRSKLIAKLASRAAKPTADRGGKRPGPGVVVVHPDEELGFLHPLPVEALWGVGPASARRLHGLGLRTVGDIAALPEDTMVRHFGQAQGAHLARLARADDPSPVVPDRPAKSVGHEETFSEDIADTRVLQRHAVRMAEAVATHLRRGQLAGRTVTVKVRFADFSTITRSHTLPFALDSGSALAAVSEALLEAVDVTAGVRLLGVSVSGLQASALSQQLTFDLGSTVPAPEGASTRNAGPATSRTGDDVAVERAPTGAAQAARLQVSWQELNAAIDAIRERYGRRSVGTASMVGDHGISVPQQREAPWGPQAPGTTDGDGGHRRG